MQRTAHPLIVVRTARDAETRVWFVETSDLPGLNVEADSLEALSDRLPGAILDLIEESHGADDRYGDAGGDRDVPPRLIARVSTRGRA